MMMFVIIIHVIVCFGLIVIVLIQRGRGSGLVESFQGVESMFGTKTSVLLTRATTVLSVIFFFTCLSLAVLSVRQSRSLMKDVQAKPVAAKGVRPLTEPAVNQTVKEAAKQVEGVVKTEALKQEMPVNQTK
ncbi:MAG: preprotein translocase subunit SecG [Candidatus Omnitrophica bacterium]|nr:preprotein translocase subunit SecG [Candidatus Omnitrophota bacterium]MBU1869415.1 preprotein translocase subunit SecG [Candidatus Omnitrophota bacterium]